MVCGLCMVCEAKVIFIGVENCSFDAAMLEVHRWHILVNFWF
jgi:hypothetical protein